MLHMSYIEHNGHFLALKKSTIHIQSSLCECDSRCDSLLWRVGRISVYKTVQLLVVLLTLILEGDRRSQKESYFPLGLL